MKIQLGRPSPALVIACISLFVALGGVGYAAATGSIDGREIKNNTLRSKDIRNSSIVGKDVKTSGLTGSDVKANSLTASDINEAGLGKVPSAGSADAASTAGDAATVGGQRVISFAYRRDTTAAATTLALLGGLRIEAACPAGDNSLSLRNLSGAPAEITLANVSDLNDTTRGVQAQLGHNNLVNAASYGDDSGASGQAGFVNSVTGRPVRVLYTLNEDVLGFDCSMSGVTIG